MRTSVMLALSLLAVTACGDSGGADAGLPGMPPVITSIAWHHATPCTAAVADNVTVTVTATDPDTATAQLTYSGSVTTCTGSITAASGVVNCPEHFSYPGTMTVKDPENHSVTKSFTISGPCTDGSQTF